MSDSIGERVAEPKPETDLFGFELHVPLSSRGNLFNQLKAFAGENGFSFYVRLMDPTRDLLGAELRRDDVWLSVYSVFEIDQYFVAAAPRSEKATADVGRQLEEALRHKLTLVVDAGISPLRK